MKGGECERDYVDMSTPVLCLQIHRSVKNRTEPRTGNGVFVGVDVGAALLGAEVGGDGALVGLCVGGVAVGACVTGAVDAVGAVEFVA